MKQYDIKGIILNKGQPTVQFSVTVNATDQTSAKRLVTMQYGPQGQVQIQKIIETHRK